MGPLETSLRIRHLYVFRNKQGIHSCLVSNFHPRLKFHLGLAKPSWNFKSAYQVEIFARNCNVILKRSLVFSGDEISFR